MKTFFIALLGALIGAFISIVTLLLVGREEEISLPPTVLSQVKNEENPFLEYYTVENAVSVSPHDIRMEMDRGSDDFIIVDLRSRAEYEKEHIRGALNIPGIDNDVSREAQEQRIIQEFQKLPKEKRIIIHCYTHYCMLAKKVGLMLAKEGINVQELNIGWNEWRYEWDLWNGEGTSESVDITKYLEGTDILINTGSTQSTEINIAPCTADGLAGC